MGSIASIALGCLMLVTGFSLFVLGSAMRKDRLRPNSWAGIRTKAALGSELAWYRVQRAGATPIIGLAVAYTDSAVLFVLQGIYYDTISVLIPIAVLTTQSIVGSIWTYRETRNLNVSQVSSHNS